MDFDAYLDMWYRHMLDGRRGVAGGMLASSTAVQAQARPDDTTGSYQNVPLPSGPLEVHPPVAGPRIGRPDRGPRTRVKAARRARRLQQSRGR